MSERDIPDFLPVSELLLMLAEEATELAQAAMKVRRCIDDLNPTRMTYTEAVTQLNEEWADVLLSKRQIPLINDEFVYQVMQYKHKRWLEHLKEHEKPKEVTRNEQPERHDDGTA